MAGTYNLKEIANKFAKKQPQMVDDLTEKTPILERCRWEAASHGLWNMAEKVNDVSGAQFVNADAALPTMDTSSDLIKQDLQVLGGEMEQAQDTVDQFGGPGAYFAMKEPIILKQAGMDTERKLYYDNWMAKAIDDGNVVDCYPNGNGTGYSIVIVRFESGVNIGLFDPTGFKAGTLLQRELINGGQLYHTRKSSGEVLGYGMALKGRFGWQNLSIKTVGAIVNIQGTAGAIKKPTQTQIEDLIADVHGDPSDTMICCHPKARNIALAPFKEAALQMGVQDKEYNRTIDTYNGIPVISSYNIRDGSEAYQTIS